MVVYETPVYNSTSQDVIGSLFVGPGLQCGLNFDISSCFIGNPEEQYLQMNFASFPENESSISVYLPFQMAQITKRRPKLPNEFLLSSVHTVPPVLSTHLAMDA